VFSRLGAEEGEENGPSAWERAKAPLEEHVDVAIGLEDAYEYFRQFEPHINFMSEHEQVEEVPNERIVWESADGLEAICVITFHEMADKLTRVMVTYEAHPHGLQKATSALRLPRRALRADLMRFKSLVEVHPDEADELYDEPEQPQARDDEPEPDEEQETEEEGEEEEAPQPAARRRSQASASQRREDKQPSRKAATQARKSAAAQPRQRAVRSGSGQSSGTGSSARRQSQPASKSRPSTTGRRG
jgi:outer membrane biosynthesis protein TonB